MSKFLIAALGFSENGEGEEAYDKDDVVGEITEVDADGIVELAFDDPLHGLRHYLRFDLGEFVALAAKFGRHS